MGSGIVFYQFVIALCMGLAALGFFVWAVLSGQFEDVEDIKYRIVEQEEDTDE